MTAFSTRRMAIKRVDLSFDTPSLEASTVHITSSKGVACSAGTMLKTPNETTEGLHSSYHSVCSYSQPIHHLYHHQGVQSRWCCHEAGGTETDKMQHGNTTQSTVLLETLW